MTLSLVETYMNELSLEDELLLMEDSLLWGGGNLHPDEKTYEDWLSHFGK